MIENVVKGTYFFWNFFKCLDFLDKAVLCFPLGYKKWHIQQGNLREHVNRVAAQINLKKEVILAEVPPYYTYLNFAGYGNTFLPGKIGITLPKAILNKNELVCKFFTTREILQIKSNRILFMHLFSLMGNFTTVYFLYDQFPIGSLFIGQAVHFVMQIMLLRVCQHKIDLESLKYFTTDEKNDLLKHFFTLKTNLRPEDKLNQFFCKLMGLSVDDKIKNIQLSINEYSLN